MPENQSKDLESSSIPFQDRIIPGAFGGLSGAVFGGSLGCARGESLEFIGKVPKVGRLGAFGTLIGGICGAFLLDKANTQLIKKEQLNVSQRTTLIEKKSIPLAALTGGIGFSGSVR